MIVSEGDSSCEFSGIAKWRMLLGCWPKPLNLTGKGHILYKVVQFPGDYNKNIKCTVCVQPWEWRNSLGFWTLVTKCRQIQLSSVQVVPAQQATFILGCQNNVTFWLISVFVCKEIQGYNQVFLWRHLEQYVIFWLLSGWNYITNWLQLGKEAQNSCLSCLQRPFLMQK